MTLADARPDVEAPEREQFEAEEEARPEAVAKRRDWKRGVVIGLGALLGLFLLLALLTGPVESIWYRTRQHHLAADLHELRSRTAPGQALGVLQVPRLGINLVVVQGDTPGLLRGAPGHRVSSAMPGTRGNVVIVGHHDAWGGPFRHLDQIRARDFIVVQSRDRKSGDFKTFVYRARAVRKVSADGSRALMGRSTDHRLTLVTGRGGRFSSDRLVISAVSGPSTAHAIRAPALHATTRGPSILFNAYVLFALLALAIALVAFRYLRRRTGTVVMVVVLAPIAAAGVLFAFLDLTLLLPPLN